MVSRSKVPRAFVTGLGGFTGHYVRLELERAGYRVFGTLHRQEPDAIDCFKVDLGDRSELKRVIEDIKPDVVAHLAAISFVAHGDAHEIYRTNVVGTRNLLDVLSSLGNKPDSVLIASSANIYGNSEAGVVDEGVTPNPANDYAVSKLAMEYMARLWMDRLSIVITRPFNYTGVGQSTNFLLPKIVEHFQRRERVIELGNIDVERDFSDVRMVANVYRRLMQLSPAGATFNVCSGTAYSLKHVLEMMADIAGYEIEVRINPQFVRRNEVKRLQGDCTRLRATLGGVDQIELLETLQWMYSGEAA